MKKPHISAVSGIDLGVDLCVYRVYIVPMKRRNMFLPDPQWNALLSLAKKTGLSVAELVRRAIDSYLKDRK